MRSIDERLASDLDNGAAVRVEAPRVVDIFLTAGFQYGVIWSLRRHGHGVTTTPASQFFGPRYRPTPDPVDVVRIDVDRAPPDGFVRVASVRIDRRNADNPFATGPEYRVVNVSVLRHRSAP